MKAADDQFLKHLVYPGIVFDYIHHQTDQGVSAFFLFRGKNCTYLLFIAWDTDSLLVDALLTIGPVAHPAFMDGRFPGIILAAGCTSELFFWREIRWHITTPF